MNNLKSKSSNDFTEKESNGKVFLHICEEFEYTWIGKDNGMIPIYMHEICGYESKILTVDLKHDLPNFERGIYFIKVKRIFGFLGNFAYWVKPVSYTHLTLPTIRLV